MEFITQLAVLVCSYLVSYVLILRRTNSIALIHVELQSVELIVE